MNVNNHCRMLPERTLAWSTSLPDFAGYMHFWPLLIGCISLLILEQKKSLGFFWAIIGLGLLIFSDNLYVQEISEGYVARSNSTMKWWGWIYSGGLVSTVPILFSKLKGKHNLYRYLFCPVYGVLFFLSTIYAYKSYTFEKENTYSHYEGYYWLQEPFRFYFKELENIKVGRVLLPTDEDGDTYGPYTSAVTLAGQKSYLSSPGLLVYYSFDWDMLEEHRRDVRQFYDPNDENLDLNLDFENIDYILGSLELKNKIERIYKREVATNCYDDFNCIFYINTNGNL